MIFAYNQIKARPKLLLAMTGLTQDEFDQLLLHFQHAWDQFVRQNYVDRANRQRQYGGGRSEATLVTLEDKLLFILYYMKVYPLQEVLAFEFGMVQSTAHEWIHLLSAVLKQALDHGGYVPKRDAKQLGTMLVPEAESTYGIDGTERLRQRPHDPEKQKYYYSGKKKAHTVKNLIVGGLHTRKVNYLSPTYEGKRHDKKIADEENPTFPQDSSLYKDTGFQGYEPQGVQTFQPQKKPRGQELTPEQRAHNTLISKVRIVIEHIIAGIKRCHIVKDIFRNTKEMYDDLVMEIACGLHNFRVEYRHSETPNSYSR
jgi:hypothetical protein